MIPFHSILPDLAQREVRCLHIGPSTESDLPADEYAFLEFYCEEPQCDCRRVFLQVMARNQPGKIFASINYGWEREAFYRKRLPWDPDAPKEIVRGELDPINPQSKFAAGFLELFQDFVLDDTYRTRLRRHYRMFKEELAVRVGRTADP